MHEAWIAELLRRAEAERGQPYPLPPSAFAKVLYGAIQNGMITARMSGSSDRLDAAADMLLGAVAHPVPVSAKAEEAVAV
jgi:TetR/AcrR family transcriptional repressor of nem operon